LQELLHGTLDALRQTVPQVVRDTENMVVSLALEVARKLVSDMPVSVPMVEAAVRDALTHVESSAQVTVRLHPADLELLQNASSALLSSAETPNDFRFLSSAEVSRGGCLVETRFGTVDARREIKFDLIKKTML
jgi:flagellar assembly protein FliH